MEIVLNTNKVTQNSQEYLMGIFKISEILRFARYTEYTILGFDDNNFPITNKQVQRKLNSAKVESIAKFLINDTQAIFPTNIVLAIPNQIIVSYEETESNSIILNLDSKVADEIDKRDKGQGGNIYISIIDGQHRIKGIEVAIDKLEKAIEEKTTLFDIPNEQLSEKLQRLKEIELPVAFFIDPVLEYQAMIFSTINRTQTKVSQDLVYSLFGLTEDDSPQKTALNIVNALNGSPKSPFYKRIRLAGSTTSKAAKEFYKDGYPILSQATMVKTILYMITNKNEAEVERNKTRKYFQKNQNNDLVFRKFYANNQDADIIKILYQFFTSVQEVFVDNNGSSFWNNKEQHNKPTNILQTTIGYESLLHILKKILLKDADKDVFDKQLYKEYLIKAKSIDIKDDNNPQKYPFANKTKKIFIDDLCKLIFKETGK
jgi:DGQHR domain-containing protein